MKVHLGLKNLTLVPGIAPESAVGYLESEITTLIYNFLQIYILDNVDTPMSGAKKSSRELAGVLRNLKKVEQALETVDAAFHNLSIEK